jgi:cellobiose phosphorylase
VNVIANSRLGTVVSESGSAYTWYGNAQLCRLTPWNNDPVGDPSGEVIYIRDEPSGRFFSPMRWPPSTLHTRAVTLATASSSTARRGSRRS